MLVSSATADKLCVHTIELLPQQILLPPHYT
jgi:hypothetical protein